MTPPPFMSGLRGTLRQNEPMSRHTSWRVGGPADYFYTPADRPDLLRLLTQLPPDLPLTWLGLGSNLLVRDGGLPGLVVCTLKALTTITSPSPGRLHAEAGATCAQVARAAIKHNLGGIEFLASIPGTFGGALATNAGAFGSETWQHIHHIETITRDASPRLIPATDIPFTYRHAPLPPDHWLLSGTLTLNPQPAAQTRTTTRHLLARRAATQPIQTANAGSVFCNPAPNHAAQLLEAAGLKGTQIGDAIISKTHANFIINRGQARAADIETLIHTAQHRVQTHAGITLSPEVRIIGIPA